MSNTKLDLTTTSLSSSTSVAKSSDLGQVAGDVLPASSKSTTDDELLDGTPSATGLVNEESGYKQRRNSIDDFIRKILAEAREEQKKLMDSVAAAVPGEAIDKTTAAAAAVGAATEPGVTAPGSLKADIELTPGTSKLATAATVVDGDLLSNVSLKSISASSSSSTAVGRSRLAASAADSEIDSELADINRYLTSRTSRIAKYDDDDVDQAADVDVQTLRQSAAGDEDAAGLQQQEQWAPFDRREFSPQKREETTQVVQKSVRPCRAVVDQQSDIIKQFKSSSRLLDELDNEIRDLLQKSVDRRAFYDRLRDDIHDETRLYESEQRASAERLDQQRLPGGRRFIREEFIASCSADAWRPTRAVGRAALDEEPPIPLALRRRAGSVSANFGSSDASSRLQVLTSVTDSATARRSVDRDVGESAVAASRQRRAVSVLSERGYSATYDVDSQQQQPQRRGSISGSASSSLASFYRPTSSTTGTTGTSDYSTGSAASYSSRYSGGSAASSLYSSGSSRFQRSSSVAATTSDYLDDADADVDADYFGRSSSSVLGGSSFSSNSSSNFSSPYSSSLTTKSLTSTGEVYYTYNPDESSTSVRGQTPLTSSYLSSAVGSSTAAGSYNSPSTRFQRSLSTTSDYSSPSSYSASPSSAAATSSYSSSSTARRYSSGSTGSSGYGSSGYGSTSTSSYGSKADSSSGGGSDSTFHSRFLDKVRQKKALEGGSTKTTKTTSSTSSTSSGDKTFKSRFMNQRQ